MIPFNRPFRAPREMDYVAQALAAPARQGNGPFTRRCIHALQDALGGHTVYPTQSCTAALEFAALLSGVGPGDEVIMPSFTFVSTANAFVLRGAKPVFVDIDPATQNLDAKAAARAVTGRTRVIVLVHYAGIACDMDAFQTLARERNLLLIEDAAQAYGAEWAGHPVGTFGEMAAISFHDTKNVSSGEGGALVVTNPDMATRAEIVWEKGTNRMAFQEGRVDKYTWIDVGSSFLPSEITAAMLLAHLEAAPLITDLRRAIWSRYDALLADRIAEKFDGVCTPGCPEQARHNGHLYYLVLPDLAARDQFIAAMERRGVSTPFHYVPLHSSPAGRTFGRTSGAMVNTDRAGAGLVRLPLFADLSLETIDRISQAVLESLEGLGSRAL